MKKFVTIIMSVALMLSMMPFSAFADEWDEEKVYGPNEPRIEDLSEYTAEDDFFATPIYGDAPEFECMQTLGRPEEDYGFSPYFTTNVRIKMDADLHVSVQSEYSGNLYVGIWRFEKDEDGVARAVEVKSAIGTTDGERSFDLNEVKANDEFFLAAALCGDTSEDAINAVDVTLKLTADSDVKTAKCKHVPWKVYKEAAVCGWDGWKTHWECMDCGKWLIKDNGEYRVMKKAEKSKYILKMPAKKHSYTKKVRNSSTLKSKATCTKAARYYYTCKHCGTTGSKTFTYGKAKGHNYKKNYIVPATEEKAGRTGTICTRCKQAKKGTKTTVIPKIESFVIDADRWVVRKGQIPAFSVKINGKKYTNFTVDIEDLDNGFYTINLKGKYSGSLFGMYFTVDPETSDEEMAEMEKAIQELKEELENNENAV